MPTESQLSLSLEAQMEFPELRYDYVPKLGPLPEFTGERIGYLQYDPENMGFKLIIDKPEDTL